MRFFKFSLGPNIRNFAYERNEWKYFFRRYSIFGLASLITPIVKEVTHNKGETVHYTKHNIICVGLIIDKSSFYGIAFFDLPIRPLCLFLIFFGVISVSKSIVAGTIWSCLFYLLESIASIRDDKLLMSSIKNRLQL